MTILSCENDAYVGSLGGKVDCVCDVQVEGISAGVELSAPNMDNCNNVSFPDLDLPANSPWASDWDEAFILVCEEE